MKTIHFTTSDLPEADAIWQWCNENDFKLKDMIWDSHEESLLRMMPTWKKHNFVGFSGYPMSTHKFHIQFHYLLDEEEVLLKLRWGERICD